MRYFFFFSLNYLIGVTNRKDKCPCLYTSSRFIYVHNVSNKESLLCFIYEMIFFKNIRTSRPNIFNPPSFHLYKHQHITACQVKTKAPYMINVIVWRCFDLDSGLKPRNKQHFIFILPTESLKNFQKYYKQLRA